ncbi:putative bifunctional diguanylate cyclase/phosphodiesterase [Roseofilum capinflatum]|uniref:EAL domain-containing protein n=1 Tax=Roseofilum capinflatum BLCC-M114 TaxID=3022440 RepID=A0ABT7B8Q1_9CYAN|nr:EAL domain-containing protein [Roseofilum capinflatum]MDJ1175559.1 EAL domain-containing protein [Roseofilum capinflatum BLCC-M114]
MGKLKAKNGLAITSTKPYIVRVMGHSVIISSAILTTLFVGLQQWGGLELLELAVFDRFTRLEADAVPDPRMAIVSITEEDLHRYRWPLSDEILAQTLAKLQTYQPRVIGLDLYRDLPTPPGTSKLETQLQAPNLIAITEIVGGIPAPPNVEAERIGFNDLTLDIDGVLRRGLLFVPTPEQDYYSFALRVSLAYLKPNDIHFRYSSDALFLGEIPLIPLEPTSGGYQTADTRGYQILLDYRGRRRVAPTLSLSQLLSGEVDPAWVRDKVVLVGTAAASLKDQVYTPYSADEDTFQMSGVTIHAQITSQLLDIALGGERRFRFWPQWVELLWLWVWIVTGTLLAWRSPHPLTLAGSAMLGLAIIGSVGWGLFTLTTIWIPVVEPGLALVAAFGLTLAYRLLHVTHYDSLTGLLNREAFLHHLGRSLTRTLNMPSTVGVMFLSLDRFERIDESLGPLIGDRLLLKVTTRLKAALPRSAQLARVSHAEFAVILQSSEQQELTYLADRLQQALSESFFLHQQSVAITLSIGIAMTEREQHYTPENLLRDAHTAMYRAQALGKERYQVFSAGMLEEVVDRFTLESDLRQGIAAQEFVLYYQPIVDLKTEKIAGFEALIRWQHPRQGFVSPFKFIPLAEETGLILPLGEWICQQACHQAAYWQQLCPQHPPMVSINLSGRQFEQPNLSQDLARIIREVGIEGSNLKFEITESMVMGDVEEAIDLMLRIKSLGCKLGLDDFGTGYSSLSHLRRFPIDTLKVDKSFVQKMGASHEDREIVRMIVSLGHTLGMDIIAEGVETQEDAEALRLLNCELGQGYFWAKPLPSDRATELLQQQYSSSRE